MPVLLPVGDGLLVAQKEWTPSRRPEQAAGYASYDGAARNPAPPSGHRDHVALLDQDRCASR